jgi:DNA-binding XRE family transcriptional regulator
MARKRFGAQVKTASAAVPGRAIKAQKPFVERFEARSSAVIKALARNVRRLRKERGWTQEELAGNCNIEQQAVSLIETGRANPTILTVESLARALNVPFVDLFEARPRLRRSISPAK